MVWGPNAEKKTKVTVFFMSHFNKNRAALTHRKGHCLTQFEMSFSEPVIRLFNKMTSVLEAAFPCKEWENEYDEVRKAGISDLPENTWLYTEGLSNRFNILSMVEEDFLLLEKEVANMKWEEARMTPVVD